MNAPRRCLAFQHVSLQHRQASHFPLESIANLQLEVSDKCHLY